MLGLGAAFFADNGVAAGGFCRNWGSGCPARATTGTLRVLRVPRARQGWPAAAGRAGARAPSVLMQRVAAAPGIPARILLVYEAWGRMPPPSE